MKPLLKKKFILSRILLSLMYSVSVYKNLTGNFKNSIEILVFA